MAREKWQIGWNLDLDYFCLVEAGWVVAIHMTVVNGWEERLCARAAADGLVASGGLVNAGQIFVPAVWLDLLGGWPLPIDWRAGDRAARRRERRAAGAERRGKLLAAARRGAREALLDSDYDDLLDDGWVLGDPTRIRKCDVDDLLSEGVIVGDEDAWLRALRERAARDRLRLRNSRMRIDRISASSSTSALATATASPPGTRFQAPWVGRQAQTNAKTRSRRSKMSSSANGASISLQRVPAPGNARWNEEPTSHGSSTTS